MQHKIKRLVSVIKDSSVRDYTYQSAEQELIKLGQHAVPALSELAKAADAVASERAKEILAKMPAQ